ncbi:serine/threonine protein kinase [Actinomadura macrotermitis]|uniref:Protein kinase domain-containing protein n=1 Tax=Actinomadura macrotermitis TaxID=2585200 RepID=A0A7K0BVC6_9ACTN|nr:serine/threonine-protein kinase [Actinomadura macrotermitis]MQY04842.1 hypothetical protein [Actinomadura macrotermitis]
MTEALPLQPGDPRRLGAYEITGRLGVGEQGAVFLGRPAGPAGRPPVAVKLLHRRLSGEPAARDRFVQAFRRARAVSGFCTAAILDAEVDGERAYVVSEYVDGPSLQQLVTEEGPRGAAVVERLAVGTAIALAAVHRAGAVHHDFKPGNVLLGAVGPQVTDFAIVAALEAVNAAAGHLAEDPGYRAPEQLSGAGIGPAADVFAWAGTMLFAATGAPPFGDDSTSEVMQRIVYDDPDLSALPESLREIVADALAKEPAERPTARVLLRRLLAEDGPLAARIPAPLVAEGRALATGPVTAQPAPEPVPAAAPVPGPAREEADVPTQAMAALPAAVPAPALAAAPHRAGDDPGDRATAMLERPVPPPSADDGTTVIPGIGAEPPRGETIVFGRLNKPRRGNHVLGVALSLVIGVVVGIAIITLVLLPQLKGDDDPRPAPAGAGGDRPVTSIPQSFAGTWKGTATNRRSGVSFPVEVTFEAGARTARAFYPKERCTGTLALTRGTGSSLEMALQIGKPCSSGAVQVARRPDGTLDYTWSKSLPGTPGYQGRLSRS